VAIICRFLLGLLLQLEISFLVQNELVKSLALSNSGAIAEEHGQQGQRVYPQSSAIRRFGSFVRACLDLTLLRILFYFFFSHRSVQDQR